MKRNLLITAILLSAGISLTACQSRNKAAETQKAVEIEVGKDTEDVKEYGEPDPVSAEAAPAESVPNFFEINRQKANTGPDKVFNFFSENAAKVQDNKAAEEKNEDLNKRIELSNDKEDTKSEDGSDKGTDDNIKLDGDDNNKIGKDDEDEKAAKEAKALEDKKDAVDAGTDLAPADNKDAVDADAAPALDDKKDIGTALAPADNGEDAESDTDEMDICDKNDFVKSQESISDVRGGRSHGGHTNDDKDRDREARMRPGSGDDWTSGADMYSPDGVIYGDPRTSGITEIDIDINDGPKAPVIGIAWTDDLSSEFYTNVYKSIEEAGGQPILLEQVETADLPYFDGRLTKGVDDTGALSDEAGKLIRVNSWLGSNAEFVIEGVDAVIFTGGSDISPSLYYEQEPWHGIEEERDFNAERDVSDYLLMDYCLDNDIPIMGLCRGMQMLGVVSGAEVIQDIPTYYARRNFPYRYEHRNEKVSPSSYRDFASHDVDIMDKDSVLWDITRTSVLKGAPSWHHQALKSVDGTRLKVTGSTTVSGIDIIEAIERTDQRFAVGYQFNPELVIARTIENSGDTDAFMSYDTAMRFFKELMDAA